MFHTISWGEYFTVMGLGLALYYAWWLVRYYPTLQWGRKGVAAGEGRAMPGWLRRLLGMFWDTTEARSADGKMAGPGAEGKSMENKGELPVPTGVKVGTPAERVGTAATEGMTAKAAAGEVIGKPDQAIPADKQESLQLELPLPVPAVIQPPVYLPEILGDLVMAITRLAGSARDDKAIELELVPAFRQLLNREPNQKLRGTGLERKVVEHIVHELKRHGLIAVDAMEVKGWWYEASTDGAIL